MLIFVVRENDTLRIFEVETLLFLFQLYLCGVKSATCQQNFLPQILVLVYDKHCAFRPIDRFSPKERKTLPLFISVEVDKWSNKLAVRLTTGVVYLVVALRFFFLKQTSLKQFAARDVIE